MSSLEFYGPESDFTTFAVSETRRRVERIIRRPISNQETFLYTINQLCDIIERTRLMENVHTPSKDLNAILDWLSDVEGAREDNKADPGGLTYRGITQTTFSGWLEQTGQPDKPVTSMTDTEWHDCIAYIVCDPIHFVALAWPVNVVLFNMAFEREPRTAIEMGQEAALMPREQIDGIMGPETEAAMNAEPSETATRLLNLMRLHMMGQAAYTTFHNGWRNRLNSLALFSELDWRWEALNPDVGGTADQ